MEREIWYWRARKGWYWNGPNGRERLGRTKNEAWQAWEKKRNAPKLGATVNQILAAYVAHTNDRIKKRQIEAKRLRTTGRIWPK